MLNRKITIILLLVFAACLSVMIERHSKGKHIGSDIGQKIDVVENLESSKNVSELTPVEDALDAVVKNTGLSYISSTNKEIADKASRINVKTKKTNSKNKASNVVKSLASDDFVNKSGFMPAYVYRDLGSKSNNYYPYGYMGDVRSLTVEQGNKNAGIYSGESCIKISYKPTGEAIAWAGVYWTEPANNWGDKGYGFNLTGAERISFWAKGAKGNETIANFIVGGITGKEYEDSDMRSIGPVKLSTEWTHYTINLEGADLSNIIGGFCVTLTRASNPEGAVFYLDEIVFE